LVQYSASWCDGMINLSRVKPSNLWYTIGYIAADGSLSIDKRHIDITSKDRKHLYSIRNVLGLKNKIGRKTRSSEKEKVYSQLQIGDVAFYRYLESLGFIQKKSLTLGPIKVDMRFFADFLRGVIDGDGSITTWIHKTNSNRQWSLRIFSASFLFINWLNNLVNKYFNIKSKLYRRKEKGKENPIYVLKFGKIMAIKILREIYYPGCIALGRKAIQAQECLQSGDKMINYTS
jgi:hypothetical protein